MSCISTVSLAEHADDVRSAHSAADDVTDRPRSSSAKSVFSALRAGRDGDEQFSIANVTIGDEEPACCVKVFTDYARYSLTSCHYILSIRTQSLSEVNKVFRCRQSHAFTINKVLGMRCSDFGAQA